MAGGLPPLKIRARPLATAVAPVCALRPLEQQWIGSAAVRPRSSMAPGAPPPLMKALRRGMPNRNYSASTPDCAQQQTIHLALLPSGTIRRSENGTPVPRPQSPRSVPCAHWRSSKRQQPDRSRTSRYPIFPSAASIVAQRFFQRRQKLAPGLGIGSLAAPLQLVDHGIQDLDRVIAQTGAHANVFHHRVECVV